MALLDKMTTLQGKVAQGKAVHYWQTGDPQSRPLVLLHGGFGDAYTQWSEVMPALGEEYAVYAPDLPGFGQSDSLGDMHAPKVLAWLEALLDTLEIESVVIIGSSFGGLFGRLFAAAKPARVHALILVNGGVIPSVPTLARGLANLPIIGSLMFNQIAGSTLTKSNLDSLVQVKEVLTPRFYERVNANRKGLARLMRGLTLAPMPEARTPALPVMLMWGEDDPIAPLNVGERIQKAIPGAQLSPLAGCGHLPQLEVSDVFVSQVLLFIRYLERGRRGPSAGMLSLKN